MSENSDNIDRAMDGSLPPILTTNQSHDQLSEITEISIQFTSQIADIASRLPINQSINVPSSLTRYGLSEIINQFLGLSEESMRPFDFLITQHDPSNQSLNPPVQSPIYLRTSLLNYCRSQSITGERGLILEVIEAMTEPESAQSQQPHPDWIASINMIDGQSFVTGCYDGIVRYVTFDRAYNETVTMGSGHRSAVKCVRYGVMDGTNESDDKLIVSASKDQSVRVWRINQSNSKSLTCLSIGTSHTASVEALAVLSESTRFASAGFDRDILIWDARISKQSEDQPINSTMSKRAKKDALLPIMMPISTISGHTDTVTALVSPFPTQLFSASNDSTIRQFDLVNGSQVHSWHSGAGKAMTSLSISHDGTTGAAGCFDGTWRMIDTRAHDAHTKTYRSHTSCVSTIAFTESSYSVVTGSYDGTVKLWDTRSHIPLTTLPSSVASMRIMSVDWTNEQTTTKRGMIVSGGTDKKVAYHTLVDSRISDATQQSDE
jgi:ribosome biogenesis protein YTM1